MKKLFLVFFVIPIFAFADNWAQDPQYHYYQVGKTAYSKYGFPTDVNHSDKKLLIIEIRNHGSDIKVFLPTLLQKKVGEKIQSLNLDKENTITPLKMTEWVSVKHNQSIRILVRYE